MSMLSCNRQPEVCFLFKCYSHAQKRGRSIMSKEIFWKWISDLRNRCRNRKAPPARLEREWHCLLALLSAQLGTPPLARALNQWGVNQKTCQRGLPSSSCNAAWAQTPHCYWCRRSITSEAQTETGERKWDDEVVILLPAPVRGSSNTAGLSMSVSD